MNALLGFELRATPRQAPRNLRLLAFFAASLAVAQPSPDGRRTFQDLQGRFQFLYPVGFGATSPGTDDGFGSVTASIRFREFSSGAHNGRIILGGEADLKSGPPQIDLQAAGGLYDRISLSAFPAEIATVIRDALPVLTADTLCDALRREQHLDPADARLSGLTDVVRGIVPLMDQRNNFAPKVLHCEVSGSTVTFDKESAFDSNSPRHHIYGAVRFLPPPYSSFQLVRGELNKPTDALLRQITTLVNSWKGK